MKGIVALLIVAVCDAISAIPLMWIAGLLNRAQPLVPAIGWGTSFTIMLLLSIAAGIGGIGAMLIKAVFD